MTDIRGLIGLLQRADWTQLSLSADVSDGSRVLIAPGRRYRCQDPDGYLTGCDGDRPWELSAEDEGDPNESVHLVGGPEAPLAKLLCPARLLDSSRLDLRGTARACGRDAIDVVITRRPSLRTGPISADDLADVVEALVDAESGILLRIAELGKDGRPDILELVRADFAPVAEASLFQPPAGSRIAEGVGEFFSGPLRPAWAAATTVGGLAAGALGAWIRYSPLRHNPTSASRGIDTSQEIARDEPAPDRAQSGSSVSDELLELLHAGGPDELAATLHEWLDVGAMAASVPGSARRAGLGGLGLLMDAVSEKSRAVHMVSEIRFAAPGTYQIDRRYQPRRRPATIACDGQRRWEVHADRITTGPAQPPSRKIGYLADPSWLLQCTLSGGDMVTAGSRTAYRISVTRRAMESGGGLMMYPAAVAVVDAELGVILRLTYYIGDKPVERSELRDVASSVGNFRPAMPAGLPVVERTQRSGRPHHG